MKTTVHMLVADVWFEISKYLKKSDVYALFLAGEPFRKHVLRLMIRVMRWPESFSFTWLYTHYPAVLTTLRSANRSAHAQYLKTIELTYKIVIPYNIKIKFLDLYRPDTLHQFRCIACESRKHGGIGIQQFSKSWPKTSVDCEALKRAFVIKLARIQYKAASKEYNYEHCSRDKVKKRRSDQFRRRRVKREDEKNKSKIHKHKNY